jgi:type IV secretory pathway VirB2 component (pilin)
MNVRRVVFQRITFYWAIFFALAFAAPEFALAQSTSPFETGATALVTSLTTLATPVAALLVMALGVAAAAGRISWGWPIGILIGIALLFAAPTVVTWMRSLFGA